MSACARRALLRLEETEHGTASQAWWRRIADKVSVPDWLAHEWAHAVRCHPQSVRPQMLFRFFALVASARIAPSRSQVRFMLRTLRRHPQTETWERLERVLDADPVQWRAHHEAMELQATARDEAAVGFAEMHADLRAFADFLSGRPGRFPLRSVDTGDVLTAATDGLEIRLPHRIRLTPYRELNAWTYLYLLGHEMQHVVGGSFDFSFTSERGAVLWKRLAPRRAVYERALEQWDLRGVLRRLSKKGRQPKGETNMPDMTRALRHFDNPGFVRVLWNLVEDVRVERDLALGYPGIAAVAEATHAHELAVAPAIESLSLERNFMVRLQTRLNGQPDRGHIGAPYQAAYDAIVPIAGAVCSTELTDAAQTLGFAIDLFEALEAHLPPGRMTDLRHEVAAPVDVIDLDVTCLGLSIPDASYIEPGDESVLELHYLPETDTDPGARRWYDEFHAWRDTHESKVAGVAESRFHVQRPPHRVSTPAPVRRLSVLNAGAVRTTDRPRATDDGRELDVSRVHDQLVAGLAGARTDPRVFRGKASAPSAGVVVSFLVDSSVSMEKPRAGLPMPFATAIQTLQTLVPALEAAGVPVGVFTTDDFGRRSIEFRVVKEHREPLDRGLIRSLHAVRAGGFRMGAAIRHLGWRSLELGSPRHVAVVLTDTSSHYFVPGMERLRRTGLMQGCRDCQHRAQCPIEPEGPLLSPAYSDEFRVFLPTYHAVADLAEAGRTTGIEPVLGLLGTQIAPALLDRLLGSDGWLRVVDGGGIDALARQLATRLR